MVYNVAHRYNDEECDACEDDQGTNVGTQRKDFKYLVLSIETGQNKIISI